MIAKAQAATATGAVTSMASGAVNYFGLSQSEWSIVGIWFGMLLGAVGLTLNWYYQRKNYELNVSKGASHEAS